MEQVLLIEAVLLAILTFSYVLLGGFMLVIGYVLWREKTGGTKAMGEALNQFIVEGEHDPDKDIPKGFEGIYKWWYDERGRKYLVSAEEYLTRVQETKDKKDKEEQYVNEFIDGMPISSDE